jgi:ComF family protein
MWESFFSSLLDYLVPPRNTDQLVRTLTPDDLYTLLVHSEERGLLPYQDERVRALVWELKYYANKHAAALAALVLHETLTTIASEELGKPLLIPVPMHKARRRARGHNQTEVLCEALLAHVGEFFVYAPDVLVRHTHTEQQQGLQKDRRLKNVVGSMHSNPKVRGRTCVVVDDVCTTGATFDEATRALKAAGARHVVCVALAKS